MNDCLIWKKWSSRIQASIAGNTELELVEASRVLLSQAEEMFGPRSDDWNYAHKVVFEDGPPHLLYLPDGSITVCLSNSARDSEYKVLSQLSHEIGHVISPAMDVTRKKLDVTYLNEGVSEYFSMLALSAWFSYNIEDVYEAKREPYPQYFEALELVIAIHNVKDDIVKQLRTINRSLNLIGAADFLMVCPKIDMELVEKLLRRFA